jgi:hypothetical protein
MDGHTLVLEEEVSTEIYEVVISYTEPVFATFIIQADSEDTIRERIIMSSEDQGYENLKFISIKMLDRDQDGNPKVTLQ